MGHRFDCLRQPVATLLLACLMVSRIRYPHLLHQLLHSRRNFYSLAQLVFAIVAVVTFHELALPLLFCLFAFSYPFTGLFRKPAPLPVRGVSADGNDPPPSMFRRRRLRPVRSFYDSWGFHLPTALASRRIPRNVRLQCATRAPSRSIPSGRPGGRNGPLPRSAPRRIPYPGSRGVV